jgi:hypothetical protein
MGFWFRADQVNDEIRCRNSHYYTEEDGRCGVIPCFNENRASSYKCSHAYAGLAPSGRCKRCEKQYQKEQQMATKQKTAAILSPDAPIVQNANGGKQSDTGTRCDLLPPYAALHVAAILHAGAKKYGENNWHAIGVNEHVNHALTHLYAFLAGDDLDDHLGHACCRMQMALEQQLTGRINGEAKT